MVGRACWPGSRNTASPNLAVQPRLTRRTALTAASLLVSPWPAFAQSADVEAGDVQIPTDGGLVTGVYARPAGSGSVPVVVVAENGAGLDRVVTDACRGLAKEGFLAIAPALFAGDVPDGTLIRRIDGAAAWATQHGGDLGRLGVVGFGPGGRLAWIYDAYSPVLKAAVAWYGPMQGTATPGRPITALDAAARLHAPLLGLYGKADGTPQRVLLDAEAKSKQGGKAAEIVVYVGAGQNFAAPGSAGFDEAATLDGWQRTVKFLRANGVV